MLLEAIDWKRPDRTWQPLMAVKTRLDTRSVTEDETRFQMDECMVRRATARKKRGRGDKSAQMYSAFGGA
jgi:hypothetical protein